MIVTVEAAEPPVFSSNGHSPSPPPEPALPPQFSQAVGHPFEPFDLVEHFRVPPKEPERLCGFFYRGGLHSIYGEPGTGKTTLGLAFVARLVRDGHRVMIIDEESGYEQIVERLLALGVTADQAHLIDYHPFPGRQWDEQDIEGLLHRIVQLRPTLILVDSASGVMSAAGLDENSNRDCSHLFKSVLLRLARFGGAAVVVIDHVAKAAANSSYARGGGVKLGLVDVTLRVEAPELFTRYKGGVLNVHVHRDRRGWIKGSTFEAVVTVNAGTIAIEINEVQAVASKASADSDSAQSKVLAVLVEARSEPLTNEEIRGRVGKQFGTTPARETVTRALGPLMKAGKVDTWIKDLPRGRVQSWVALP